MISSSTPTFSPRKVSHEWCSRISQRQSQKKKVWPLKNNYDKVPNYANWCDIYYPGSRRILKSREHINSYLKNRPFSFKELKISFNHLEFNFTLNTSRKSLQFFLITIYNSFSIEFYPKCYILLSNLFR